MNSLYIRFYEELNDFLPQNKRKLKYEIQFSGKQTVKNIIQSQNIPHTEVDLIIVNGESVNFDYLVKNNDHISVYPEFEALDISPIYKLRKKPLRITKFVLDVHLGKLTKYLRLMGFDAKYENNFSDKEIVEIAIKEKRIILTCDTGILKRALVERGYKVRNKTPKNQLTEIFKRFDLYDNIKLLKRCSKCNGVVTKIKKKEVETQLLPQIINRYDDFYQCKNCRQIYWKGDHYINFKKLLSGIME